MLEKEPLWNVKIVAIENDLGWCKDELGEIQR